MLEGAVGGEQGGVFAAVPFEDIVGHIIAFIPGEVDIEVGRGATLWVDEPFEVEVEFEGFDIGDKEAVGDDGVGATSAAYVVVTGYLGVSDDIPGDEKVSAEVHFSDDFKFFFNSFLCFSMVVSIASDAAFMG